MAKNIFNSVKMTRPNRNKFDLTHDVKLSMKFGELTPVCVLDCIPGDRYTIGCESLIRLAPLVSPLMHRLDARIEYFFIPKRLIWPNWEKYITNTDLDPGTPGVKPAAPFFNINSEPSNWGRLLDYMGIPPHPVMEGLQEKISPMALAAYQFVINEYYRDQNLQNEIPYLLNDGDNTANTDLTVLRLRAYEADYFTKALPFAQKGEQVTIPLSGFNDVPVIVNPLEPPKAGAFIKANEQLTPGPGNIDVGYTVVQDTTHPEGELWAKTSDVNETEATINELRTAFRLQEFFEKLARGGSRYVESILSFFGVKSPDARLQRPEYIVGVKSPVVVSEIVNTTGTTELPQGNMSGHGVGAVSGKYGKYFCQEHGFIIGIMSVMPKTAYQQGIPRHFLKTGDLYDHYFPQFANIGEQEVFNKEVYAWQGAAGMDTFGYNPRYSEYKFEPNRVAGDFRTTLDTWTATRIFDSPPSLNDDFVMCDPDDLNRIFAVTDTAVDKLYCHVLNKVYASKGMPKYGTPSF